MSGPPAPDAFCVDVAKSFVTTAKDSGVLLKLRVSPGAARTAFAELYGDSALKLRVAAPPENGRANAAASDFLAEALDVGRNRVEILRGAASRDKVVLIQDSTLDAVETRILRTLDER
ncbi:MAG: DUF167 domain-containing protein [Rubrobacteraceae bacterium]